MECWVGEEMSESETHQGQRVGRAVRVPDKAESRRGCSGVRTPTSCDVEGSYSSTAGIAWDDVDGGSFGGPDPFSRFFTFARIPWRVQERSWFV